MTAAAFIPDQHSAIAIMVDDRFFYRFRNGRVDTAWCIAGARLFQRDTVEPTPRYQREVNRIRRIRPRAKIEIVSIEALVFWKVAAQ